MTNDDRDRLARIEQGLVHIHEKFDLLITPLTKRQNAHHDDITILKRDRGWVYGIVVMISSVGVAIAKYVK